jgi:hypothetical protein
MMEYDFLEGLEERLLAGMRQSRREQAKKRTAQDRWNERQRSLTLMARQAAIDCNWERILAERAKIEAEAARTCHTGPGDPDYRRIP